MYVDVCVFSLLVNSPVCMQMQIQSYWLDFWGSNGVTQHQWKKTICHKRANLQILDLFRKFANIQKISLSCLCSLRVNISLSSFIYDNLCLHTNCGICNCVWCNRERKMILHEIVRFMWGQFGGDCSYRRQNEKHFMTWILQWKIKMPHKTMLVN